MGDVTLELACDQCWEESDQVFDVMRDFKPHSEKENVYVCTVCGHEQAVVVLGDEISE